jgi:hypothetical protein
MTDDKPKRRWLRFSLRTFLLVVTALCVWLAFKVNAGRRQHEAVTAILNAGGTVMYDYQFSSPRTDEYSWIIRSEPNALPSGPAFLRKTLGDDCFRTAVVVFWNKSDIPEPVFRQLENLPDLTNVNLKGVKIVPDGSGVPRPIQDSDLAVFSQLRRLASLEIWVSEIQGSGLANLNELRNLRNLVIVNAMVNDTGVKTAGELRQVERLELRNNQITDDGLKYLQHLVNLKELWLQTNTGITDVGLKYLSGLTQLKGIWLNACGTTPAGIQDLQKSLPNCKISGP